MVVVERIAAFGIVVKPFYGRYTVGLTIKFQLGKSLCCAYPKYTLLVFIQCRANRFWQHGPCGIAVYTKAIYLASGCMKALESAATTRKP